MPGYFHASWSSKAIERIVHKKQMPHLTIAQRAEVALAVSGLIVTVALVLDGLKVAFSVFVLIWGRIAAMVIVGEEIRGVVSRFLWELITWVVSTGQWFIPIFLVLTFTNPKPRRHLPSEEPKL